MENFFALNIPAFPEDWDGDYKDVADYMQPYFAEKAEELLGRILPLPRLTPGKREAMKILRTIVWIDAASTPRHAADFQEKYWESVPLFKRVLGLVEPEG